MIEPRDRGVLDPPPARRMTTEIGAALCTLPFTHVDAPPDLRQACPKAKQLRRTRHAPRRRQQVPHRERCGNGNGRIAAPVLDAGAAVGGIARGRRPAEEDRRDGRGTARLPRLPRRGRRHRPVLSASRRQSLARPQRGMRHPLRLSWLEVRHRRRLRRHADLLSRSQRQGPDPHQVLSGARMGRHDLGLYGPGGCHAGIAGAGDGAGAGLAPLRHQEMAGLQLGAGDGRLDRHRAFHLRASVASKRKRTKSSTSRSIS